MCKYINLLIKLNLGAPKIEIYIFVKKYIAMKIKIFFSILLLSVFVFSCVPLKEFEATQENLEKSKDENLILSSENEDLNTQNTELKSKVEILDAEVKQLVIDSTNRAANIIKTNYNLKKLQKQYDDLQLTQDALLKGSASETRKLLQEIQKTQENLQTQEDALRELETKLNARQRNLEVLQNQMELKNEEIQAKNKILEDRNQRLVELEQVLFEKDSLVNALKNKVSDALMGFEGRGLSITQKNGKVYVSMDEKLLFKSGSFVVSPNGVNALQELSSVLADNPDINILVEGHTDDVPYNGQGALLDNWDLSVKRATSVVRILLNNASIDAVRITAGGRSKYLPLDNSKTAEGRAKNRRTEIVLSPNIDELYNLLQ